MFATGETVGLAEWIIDDTFLVLFIFLQGYYILTKLTLFFNEILKSCM